jgi:hypothetical protein
VALVDVSGAAPPPPVALLLGPPVGLPGNGASFVTPNQPQVAPERCG